MSGGDWKEMYVAVQRGDIDLVKYHIRNGVDPNYQHPEILSLPLVTAIIEGHIEIAKFLLENGADPLLISYYDNKNAQQAAIEYKREEIIKMIPPKESLIQKILKKLKK
jgi:ankyrin repeat protein